MKHIPTPGAYRELFKAGLIELLKGSSPLQPVRPAGHAGVQDWTVAAPLRQHDLPGKTRKRPKSFSISSCCDSNV